MERTLSDVPGTKAEAEQPVVLVDDDGWEYRLVEDAEGFTIDDCYTCRLHDGSGGCTGPNRPRFLACGEKDETGLYRDYYQPKPDPIAALRAHAEACPIAAGDTVVEGGEFQQWQGRLAELIDGLSGKEG